MLVGKIDTDDELFQYFHDGFGSTIMVSDTTGSFQNLYTYDDFGNFRSTEESVPNHYYYTGQERDEEPSGLYNLRARYYAAGIGRFTQEDPYYSFSGMANPGGCGSFSGVARILIDDPRYVNFYVYGLNNPKNYKDITGLTPTWLDACDAWEECLGGVRSKWRNRLNKAGELLSDCIKKADVCNDPDAYSQKIDKCIVDYHRRTDFNQKSETLWEQRCNDKYGRQCGINHAIDFIFGLIYRRIQINIIKPPDRRYPYGA